MDRVAQTKVTEQQYERIETLARNDGLTVSGWVYQAIKEKARKAGVKFYDKRKYKRKDDA